MLKKFLKNTFRNELETELSVYLKSNWHLKGKIRQEANGVWVAEVEHSLAGVVGFMRQPSFGSPVNRYPSIYSQPMK